MPVTAGVPLITPVLEFRLMPAMNGPPVKVTGAVIPLDTSGLLATGWFTVPASC